MNLLNEKAEGNIMEGPMAFGMPSIPDEAFRAMAHPERRELLVALAEHNSRTDTSLHMPDDLSIEDRDSESLHISLYHNHLPRLETAGFIRWDRDTQQVTAGPQFDALRPLLSVLQKTPDGHVPHE